MRFLTKLSLKFSDSKMEDQFSVVKDQRVVQDFQMVVWFLLAMHILIIIPSLINENYTDVYITVVPIGLLIFSYIMKNKWQKYIQYLTLLGLVSFNLSRLISLIYSYPGKVEARLYTAGYSYGAIQALVILLLHKIPYKVLGAVVSYVLRMALIMGAIDTRAFDYVLLIRHFIIDAFMIYAFYSAEQTERKVFQDYYENREELVKFKELLQDSLPQSVTILDCGDQRPLFSNNHFLENFDHFKEVESDRQKTDQVFIELQQRNSETMKPNLHCLAVDVSTIREVGEVQASLKVGEWSDDHPSLEKTLKKLISLSLLSDNRVLSLTASYTNQSQHRLFEVILRNIKWDRADAVAIILNDITYRENITSLKVANQTKDTIIATVSHELRTPLHGIIGLMESTEKKVEDPEIANQLSLCKSNMYLLWSLVNSLLDFHHISTGNLRLNLTRTNIRKVFKEVVKLFQFQASLKKLALDLSVGTDVPYYIFTDKDRLKQILVSLVSNALKFTFSGSIKIDVVPDLEKHGDCLAISVADTGIGIKNEDKDKLFKIQEKRESGTNVRKNGVGLNLTIANSIAKALTGSEQKTVIKVKSEEGVGSVFYFQLRTNLQAETNNDFVLEKEDDEGQERQEEEEKRRPGSIYNDLHIGKVFRKPKEENSDSLSNGLLEESDTLIDIPSKIATYTTYRRTSIQGLDSEAKARQESLRKSGVVPPKIANFQAYINDRNSQDYLELPKSPEFLSKSNERKGYVLIVDDTPLNLLVAENLIKSLGYPVKTALSGHEAIKLMQTCTVERQEIKVVLMDCQMPILDGYETTKVLKEMMKKNEIQNAPIIAWTANNGDEDIQRCYECGMIGHLTKPTSKEELMKTLLNLE